MIGIKDQCFGVEVEMTGITREQEQPRRLLRILKQRHSAAMIITILEE